MKVYFTCRYRKK